MEHDTLSSTNFISERGFKVICTDIIPEALRRLRDEGFETAEFDFRDAPKIEWARRVDGSFANAVFLHAPRYFRYHTESEIREILSRLHFEIISLSHAEQGKRLHVVMKAAR